MARTLQEIVHDQLGGLAFMLCQKDAEIELLKEEIEKLKFQISKPENPAKE